MKSPDTTLMRPDAVPKANKGTVSSHEKRPRLERGRALEEAKSMKQSELDDYQYSGERPWQDEELLRSLYWNSLLSLREIADELGCSYRTVWNNFDEHDLRKRTVSEGMKASQSKQPVPFIQDHRGYERWRTEVDGATRGVYVHRLLAVSEFGFDAVAGMEVHHENEIPWDNRSSNISLKTPSEHSRHHLEDGDRPRAPEGHFVKGQR